MVPVFNPMSCPNLAVPAQVMLHVVQVESGANPFAIGVVGGRLERQPRNLGEAIATTRMLESKGYDYSVGIVQINRSNLLRYGLDSLQKAFDGCANLTAGARILAECYGRSGGDWGKAFSCYYSGNFTTGYRDGYVQRIYEAITTGVPDGSEPITVRPRTRERPGMVTGVSAAKSGTAAYRLSMRAVTLDSDTRARVSAIARTTTSPTEKTATPAQPSTEEMANREIRQPLGDSAFVPRVSGPDDAHGEGAAQPAHPSTLAVPAEAGPGATANQDISDAAFVF